jgi:hypothetical protein
VCTTVDMAHIDTIFKFLPHTRQHECSDRTAAVKNVSVAVNNFIKVGPLVFLLWVFVITENIMKRPVSLLQLFSETSK